MFCIITISKVEWFFVMVLEVVHLENKTTDDRCTTGTFS